MSIVPLPFTPAPPPPMTVKCAADSACPYPVQEGSDYCRHHQQFYAYNESLTGSSLDGEESLDAEDYVAGYSGNHDALLSVVLGVGEPWLKWIPPKRRDYSDQGNNFESYIAELRERREITLKQIRFLLSVAPNMSACAVARRLGISKSCALDCFKLLKHYQPRSAREIREVRDERRKLLKALVEENPNLLVMDYVRLLQERHGISSNRATVYEDVASVGRMSRQKKIEQRRQLLRELLESEPNTNARQLYFILKDRYGMDVNYLTVLRDVRRFGQRKKYERRYGVAA